MSGEFTGKAVIVTGASSGLGKTIAIDLAAHGADLWLVGRNASALGETAAAINAAGGTRAETAVIDLRQRGPLSELVAAVGKQHPHLFAIINNAGVMHPEPILTAEMDRWQAMLDINVMATLEGSKAAAEAMRAHGREGHIVNIGSLQGRFEEPGVYGITKKAAEMISATLRAELERDPIRVATVVPGGFATQLMRGFDEGSMQAIARNFANLGVSEDDPDMALVIADPQHIANAVRYILSQPIGINIQEMVVRPPISTKAS